MPPQLRRSPGMLVVDDEPGLRDMLAILFRREGFDVTLAPGFAARARTPLNDARAVRASS